MSVRVRMARRALALSFGVLLQQRTRTGLAVAGVMTAVATVVVIAAFNAGAERRIVERVRAMGTNVLSVSAAPAPRIAGRSRQRATVTLLRPADAAAIAGAAPLAVAAAPVVNRSMLARSEDRTTTVTVSATTAAGLAIRGLRAARSAGRVFDEAEDRLRRRVALVGPTVARVLFSGSDPVGASVRLGRVPFEVIGVLEARGTDVAGTDQDNVIVIPLETAMRRLLNVAFIDQVIVQAVASDRLDALETDVRAILAARHPVRAGMPEPWVIQNQAVLLRTERGARRIMRLAAAIAASLALAVGGYGIAAAMLLSVRDRVHEIGVRRAVGARRRDVVAQFLVESAIIGFTGGVAGALVGSLAAAIASATVRWDLVLSWPLAGFTALSAAAIGLAAGAIPAARAAHLEPAMAIRTAKRRAATAFAVVAGVTRAW